jgi:hypothetical protein
MLQTSVHLVLIVLQISASESQKLFFGCCWVRAEINHISLSVTCEAKVLYI